MCYCFTVTLVFTSVTYCLPAVVLQKLCQVALPLARSMEFLHEDVESMSKEFRSVTSYIVPPIATITLRALAGQLCCILPCGFCIIPFT